MRKKCLLKNCGFFVVDNITSLLSLDKNADKKSKYDRCSYLIIPILYILEKSLILQGFCIRIKIQIFGPKTESDLPQESEP